MELLGQLVTTERLEVGGGVEGDAARLGGGQPEVDVGPEAVGGRGLPGLTIVGLPDASCREARDRVRAAVLAAKEPWPDQKITVNLAPSNTRKVGSGLDLAIAIGVLAASSRIEAAGRMAIHADTAVNRNDAISTRLVREAPVSSEFVQPAGSAARYPVAQCTGIGGDQGDNDWWGVKDMENCCGRGM